MMYHHPGNDWFRMFVRNNRFLYRSCPKHAKSLVAKKIVAAIIQEQNPPGRFLFKSSTTKDDGNGNSVVVWKQITYKQAVGKTSEALREKKHGPTVNTNNSTMEKFLKETSIHMTNGRLMDKDQTTESFARLTSVVTQSSILQRELQREEQMQQQQQLLYVNRVANNLHERGQKRSLWDIESSFCTPVSSSKIGTPLVAAFMKNDNKNKRTKLMMEQEDDNKSGNDGNNNNSVTPSTQENLKRDDAATADITTDRNIETVTSSRNDNIVVGDALSGAVLHRPPKAPKQQKEHHHIQVGVHSVETMNKVSITSSISSPSLNTSNTTYQTNTFEERLAHLVDYKEKNGHCNVPHDFKGYKNLGTWVDRQRHQYKNFKENKTSSLTEERICALEMLGFNWKLKFTFEDRLEQLSDYRKNNGDCNVPQGFKGYRNLGWWVNVQRKQYKNYKENKPSPITKERICALEKLDFEWGKRRLTFETRLAQLTDYKEKNGDCNVPYNFKGYINLGAWVIKQRHIYKKENRPKSMTKERICALENLDFNFKWEAGQRPVDGNGVVVLSPSVPGLRVPPAESAEEGFPGNGSEDDDCGGWRDLGDEYYDSDGDCWVI
jgi:hypothetical protein